MARTTSMAGAVVCLLLLTPAAPVAAQPAPDPGLWNIIRNPNGQRIVPVVYYDPQTHILSIDTRGMDRQVNTVGNSVIGGDDVGMITVLHNAWTVAEVLPPFRNHDFDMGIIWSHQQFAGKYQMIGTAILGQFAYPGVYPLFRFHPGSQGVVGSLVEMAVNFSPQAPGNVLLGSIQEVPEPMPLTTIGTLLVSLLGWRLLKPTRANHRSTSTRSTPD